jgi:hypothetical protein
MNHARPFTHRGPPSGVLRDRPACRIQSLQPPPRAGGFPQIEEREMAKEVPELEINPEIVCQIVDRAHEFHAQDEVDFEEEPEGPADMTAVETLSEYAEEPTYLEIKSAIDDLEPDQQVALVALMWLGRGDFSVEEWDDALSHAKDAWTAHTADYLIATPLVADYLEEGLSQLGHSCD